MEAGELKAGRQVTRAESDARALIEKGAVRVLSSSQLQSVLLGRLKIAPHKKCVIVIIEGDGQRFDFRLEGDIFQQTGL